MIIGASEGLCSDKAQKDKKKKVFFEHCRIFNV